MSVLGLQAEADAIQARLKAEAGDSEFLTFVKDRTPGAFVRVSTRGEGPTSIDDATPAEWDAASAKARESMLPAIGRVACTATGERVTLIGPRDLEELRKLGLTPRDSLDDLRRRRDALQNELEQERLRVQIEDMKAELVRLRRRPRLG